MLLGGCVGAALHGDTDGTRGQDTYTYYCFVAGTPVATPQGERPIESIEPGQEVLAFDTATRETVVRRVSKRIRGHADRTFRLTVAGRVIAGVTAEHPFYDPERDAWVPAGQMRPGQALVGWTGHRAVPVQLEEVSDGLAQVPVYTLSVDGPEHNYFAAGVLVHNKETPPTNIPTNPRDCGDIQPGFEGEEVDISLKMAVPQLGVMASVSDRNADGADELIVYTGDEIALLSGARLGDALSEATLQSWRQSPLYEIDDITPVGRLAGRAKDGMAIGGARMRSVVVVTYATNDFSFASLDDHVAHLTSGEDDDFGHDLAYVPHGAGSASQLAVASGSQGNGYAPGAVYLFDEPVRGDIDAATADHIWRGEAEDKAGAAVASAGDVDGDGFGDLVVGSYTGSAWIVLGGGPGGVHAMAAADQALVGSTEHFGHTVGGGRDIDGDGLADAWVSDAYGEADNHPEGAVFLFGDPLAASGPADATAVLVGEQRCDSFGELVEAVGDRNADGEEDFIVHAGSASQTFSVFHGPFSGVVSAKDAATRLKQDEDFGSDHGIVHGDFDGDGGVDVVVRASSGWNDRLLIYLSERTPRPGGSPESPGGCGCRVAPAGAAPWMALLIAVLWGGRRAGRGS